MSSTLSSPHIQRPAASAAPTPSTQQVGGGSLTTPSLTPKFGLSFIVTLSITAMLGILVLIILRRTRRVEKEVAVLNKRTTHMVNGEEIDQAVRYYLDNNMSNVVDQCHVQLQNVYGDPITVLQADNEQFTQTVRSLQSDMTAQQKQIHDLLQTLEKERNDHRVHINELNARLQDVTELLTQERQRYVQDVCVLNETVKQLQQRHAVLDQHIAQLTASAQNNTRNLTAFSSLSPPPVHGRGGSTRRASRERIAPAEGREYSMHSHNPIPTNPGNMYGRHSSGLRRNNVVSDDYDTLPSPSFVSSKEPAHVGSAVLRSSDRDDDDNVRPASPHQTQYSSKTTLDPRQQQHHHQQLQQEQPVDRIQSPDVSSSFTNARTSKEHEGRRRHNSHHPSQKHDSHVGMQTTQDNNTTYHEPANDENDSENDDDDNQTSIVTDVHDHHAPDHDTTHWGDEHDDDNDDDEDGNLPDNESGMQRERRRVVSDNASNDTLADDPVELLSLEDDEDADSDREHEEMMMENNVHQDQDIDLTEHLNGRQSMAQLMSGIHKTLLDTARSVMMVHGSPDLHALGSMEHTMPLSDVMHDSSEQLLFILPHVIHMDNGATKSSDDPHTGPTIEELNDDDDDADDGEPNEREHQEPTILSSTPHSHPLDTVDSPAGIIHTMHQDDVKPIETPPRPHHDAHTAAISLQSAEDMDAPISSSSTPADTQQQHQQPTSAAVSSNDTTHLATRSHANGTVSATVSSDNATVMPDVECHDDQCPVPISSRLRRRGEK